MPAAAWLLIAVVAGVGTYLVGWPALQAYRSRESRDLQAERYMAWRGRASRGPRASAREGMTGEERRRLTIAIGLALVAAGSLVGFFANS